MTDDIYRVPRCFDLATLLAGMVAFALLFTVMRLLALPAGAFAFFAGLCITVAASQSLFGDADPRQASLLSGWAYSVVTLLAACLVFGGAEVNLDSQLPIALTSAVLFGAVLGYVAGVLVGGVFLVADYVRAALRVLRRHSTRRHEDGTASSPWDESEFD
ncbi:MAG: hypothetical protein AAF961_19620 [Planctomycetota bacterium]